MAQQNLSSRGRQNDKKAAPKQLNRTSKTSDTPRKYVKRGDDDSKSFSGPKKNYKSSGSSSPGKRYDDREGDSKSFSKDRRSNSDQSDRPKINELLEMTIQLPEELLERIIRLQSEKNL
jgi:hypothetical protein